MNGMISQTRQIAETAVLAALYIVLSFLPFSSFIGGAGFITANVIVLPVIAVLLTPMYALIAGIIGGLGLNIFMMGLATVMPGYSVVIVAFTALLGSIAFHYRKYAWIVGIWLMAEGSFYMAFYGFQATPLWLTHYVIGILGSFFYAINLNTKWAKQISVPWMIFGITMVENSMMNIGSMLILNLPAALWIMITPASIIERVLATIGATAIYIGLRKFAPNYFPVSEVKQ